MHRSIKLNSVLRASLLSLIVLPLSFEILAQDDETLEEVIVTGSYIKGAPEDAPLPVTTIQRDDLVLEGSPTAIDLIKSLSFSRGADGETDQFQAGAGADRATINIRGLGPSRTLVLVNGQRTTWSPHAIAAQAQLLVDVNMIPSIALQRVELLRDGAAATYGSDAIAGVANFITRSDFEGLEVTASHKDIKDSDGDQEFGIIYGQSFMGDRAHIVTSASYIKRNELDISSRDWSLLPYGYSTRGGWSSVGRPAVFVPYDTYDASPLGPGFGSFALTGINDPNCEKLGGTETVVTPLIPLSGYPRGGFCRFQYTAFDNLIEEQSRWQWMTEARFDVNDTTTLSLEFLMTESEVPNWNTSPSYPPNRLINRGRSIRANNPGLIDMAENYEAYRPYAACDQVYCEYDTSVATGKGQTEWDEIAWVYGRYYGQDGPVRGHFRESDVTRFVAALDGEFMDYGYRVSLNYSESNRRSQQGDTMDYRDARGREGLAGFECEKMVPNEYNKDGQLEFSLETLKAHAGKGVCSYWIPFSNAMRGANPLVKGGAATHEDYNPDLDNQKIYDYMLTTGVSYGETSLLVLEGVVSGATDWDLPGGSINFAAGMQYRDETYKSGQEDGNYYDGTLFPCNAGPEQKTCTTGRTGLFNFLPPGFPIDSDRDIIALFGEFLLPISEDSEGQFSLRHEYYGGETGSTTDLKIGVKSQITDILGIRFSYGTSFRGPTLNQTVASQSSNSLQFVAVTGAFKRVDTRGNPSLKPEEADTINVGFIVDHDGLFHDSDNLFMTLDYWSYDFTNPLVTEPFANIVSLACPTAGQPCDKSSPYFDRIVFGTTSDDPTSASIEIINVNIVNGPDYQTDGFDFTMRYGIELGPGYITGELTGTQILAFDIEGWVFSGGEPYDALGRLNYRTSLARTTAERKGRMTVNYEWRDLNVRWSTNYIDKYLYQGAAPQPTGDAIVPTHITHDMHLTYSLFDGALTLTGSVINIEDDDPPHMSREFNYDAFSHNPFGRILRFGVTYNLNMN